MKTRYLIPAMLALCLGLALPASGQWTVTQVTDNDVHELGLDISGSRIVWAAPGVEDDEIFLYDAATGTTTQLTNDVDMIDLYDLDDEWPVVSGTRVVWRSLQSNLAYGHGAIRYYNGLVSIEQLRSDNKLGYPSLSGSLAAWTESDDTQSAIYTYDGQTSKVELPSPYTLNFSPHVSGDNVVWYGTDDGSEYKIFRHDTDTGVTTTLAEGYSLADEPQASGDRAVWRAREGAGDDIHVYLYEDGAVTPLTPDGSNPGDPTISGSNVAWINNPEFSATCEVFFYDGETVTQLTDNTYSEQGVQVSGSMVAWSGLDAGGDAEIFVYDGQTVTQLTDNDVDDYQVRVSGSTVVWRQYDGNDWDVFMAVNPTSETEFVDVGEDQETETGGGSGETGGIDALFDEITLEGEFSGQFDPTPIADLTPEELELITFFMPTDPMMIWDIQFTGEFTGLVELTFGYDDSLLLPGFDEADLWVWHTLQGPPVSWEELTVVSRDLDANTITVLTGSFSEFAIGSPVPEPATLLLMTAAGLPMVLKRRRSRS